MHVINAENVYEALPMGLELLKSCGIQRESRNGPVIVANMPVTTRYKNPTQRVLFWAARDANPFFHFFEALWMIAGYKDLAFVERFAKNMRTYSDDGHTLHGAYGWRWRGHFNDKENRPLDQLSIIIDRLKRNPDDRRCVLQMWDPTSDLENTTSKDLPCNICILFTRNNEGALDMTVCQRSGDIIWGVHGANAVHLSVLQEYIAVGIGCAVGEYWQVTNNYHAYLDKFNPLIEKLDKYRDITNPYINQEVESYPICNSYSFKMWNEELLIFMMHLEGNFITPFFKHVVMPMMDAHTAYKAKEYGEALKIIRQCHASDWRKACIEWLYRRNANYLKAQDNGVDYDSEK